MTVLHCFTAIFKPLNRYFSGTTKKTLTAAINSSAISDSNYIIDKVNLLLARGHLEEAISLFYSLDPPDFPHAYARFFQACAGHGRLDLGRALHRHLLDHEAAAPEDLYTTNHLVNMYAKCGDLSMACQVFEKMPQRNFVTWTSLISGFAQHGKVDECFGMFSSMLSRCRPNDFAYTSVLSVCDGSRGRQVHVVVLKTGFSSCLYVANALISMYWRSSDAGFGKNADYGNNDEAWMVFEGLEFRNLVTWNAMIAGFQQWGQCYKAVTFFTTMRRDGVGFDRATLVSVVSSFWGREDENFPGLRCCLQLHGVVVKMGFIFDVAVVTALLNTYLRLGREVGSCHQLFLETSGYRDVILWTGIMAAFAVTDHEETLLLFNSLRREGLRPDCYAFSSALKACGKFVTDKYALAVYCLAIKGGCKDAIVLLNASIHAFARCGSISLSMQVFDEMSRRDVVSWNSILKACALHGLGKEALKIFKKMNVEPDGTTFVALLSACSHSGMVKEGTEIFDSMLEKYGVVPQLDHYASMVDILGRAGQLREAEKVIKDMPMEPDYVVWSALAGACRKHGETQLANFAVSNLKELDPGNSLGYVLMSNIYCSAGNFVEAGLIRKNMEGIGIRKEIGLSWTEIGNNLHEFTSGGKGHPQRDTILANTKELVKKLKKLGYVPDTRFALHDVEDEHKEEELYFHSEKLTLVFCLMNPKVSGTVRIMKNLRICPDCHNFMKLASELVQREIVVRDSNRFHVFKNGFCSCNDYW